MSLFAGAYWSAEEDIQPECERGKWSRDLYTGLWLVNTDHVTWILAPDWLMLQVISPSPVTECLVKFRLVNDDQRDADSEEDWLIFTAVVTQVTNQSQAISKIQNQTNTKYIQFLKYLTNNEHF